MAYRVPSTFISPAGELKMEEVDFVPDYADLSSDKISKETTDESVEAEPLQDDPLMKPTQLEPLWKLSHWVETPIRESLCRWAHQPSQTENPSPRALTPGVVSKKIR